MEMSEAHFSRYYTFSPFLWRLYWNDDGTNEGGGGSGGDDDDDDGDDNDGK